MSYLRYGRPVWFKVTTSFAVTGPWNRSQWTSKSSPLAYCMTSLRAESADDAQFQLFPPFRALMVVFAAVDSAASLAGDNVPLDAAFTIAGGTLAIAQLSSVF